MTTKIRDRKTFFLDLDQTIWNWDKLLPGAEDLINTLREKNKKVKFHTDNNNLSREGYAEKLSSMNIPSDENDIITSGYVAAQKLADENIKEAYVIGEQGIIEEIQKKDIEISEDAEIVVADIDRQFNYEKMEKAMKILRKEGKLVTTGTEKTFKTGNTVKPGQKAVNNALKTFTNQVEMVGKPSQKFKDTFRNYFTYIPQDSIMIGDRPADIKTGKKLGIRTGVVMTGNTTKKDIAKLEKNEKPDFALTNLNRLKKKII